LEAVAAALAEQVAALSDGPPAQEICCVGDAAQSDLWLHVKADVLGMTVATTQCPEPTSLGAAVLAEAALAEADVRQIGRQRVRLKLPHAPDPKRHRQYQPMT
jgi:sugar (pentulose or hexulose) kinase